MVIFPMDKDIIYTIRNQMSPLLSICSASCLAIENAFKLKMQKSKYKLSHTTFKKHAHPVSAETCACTHSLRHVLHI